MRQSALPIPIVASEASPALRLDGGDLPAARGRLSADLVATLAILASVLLQQPLVGLVIVLMQTGGEALERYAEGRASDAVRALEEAAPRTAHRVRDGRVEDVRADDVAVGDALIVRPGEL